MDKKKGFRAPVLGWEHVRTKMKTSTGKKKILPTMARLEQGEEQRVIAVFCGMGAMTTVRTVKDALIRVGLPGDSNLQDMLDLIGWDPPEQMQCEQFCTLVQLTKTRHSHTLRHNLSNTENLQVFESLGGKPEGEGRITRSALNDCVAYFGLRPLSPTENTRRMSEPRGRSLSMDSNAQSEEDEDWLSFEEFCEIMSSCRESTSGRTMSEMMNMADLPVVQKGAAGGAGRGSADPHQGAKPYGDRRRGPSSLRCRQSVRRTMLQRKKSALIQNDEDGDNLNSSTGDIHIALRGDTPDGTHEDDKEYAFSLLKTKTTLPLPPQPLPLSPPPPPPLQRKQYDVLRLPPLHLGGAAHCTLGPHPVYVVAAPR